MIHAILDVARDTGICLLVLVVLVAVFIRIVANSIKPPYEDE